MKTQAKTVGELIQALQKLPPNLPVASSKDGWESQGGFGDRGVSVERHENGWRQHKADVMGTMYVVSEDKISGFDPDEHSSMYEVAVPCDWVMITAVP